MFEEVAHAGVAVAGELVGNLAAEAPPFAGFADVLFPVPVAWLSLSPAVYPVTPRGMTPRLTAKA